MLDGITLINIFRTIKKRKGSFNKIMWKNLYYVHKITEDGREDILYDK